MTSGVQARVQRRGNTAWDAARPVLAVLVPYFRDDPRPLAAALDAQARAVGGVVELILLDDGSGDAALAEAVDAAVDELATPACSLRLSRNGGRAGARNRLVEAARAEALLFVDSGLIPDGPDFLGRWLAVAGDPAVTVAYGGLKVDGAPVSPATALHRAMAQRSDCLPARARRRAPEKYVYTNNLLVRREAARAEPFDEGFVGWGWEDVEWAMRAGGRWPIVHIDNPVQNRTLDTVDGLMRKYRQAAPNYARILKAHEAAVSAFPATRAARALKRVPLRKLWLSAAEGVARSSAAPMRLRELALKVYRAGLYAQAL